MSPIKTLALCLVLAVAAVPARAQEVEPDLKVAFFGDQGLNARSQAVLRMVKAEGADMILLLGDFDYHDDADAFDGQLTDVLGVDFPVFAAMGNHDVRAWPAYRQKLQGRLQRVAGVRCEGDLGVRAACTYKGLFFALSAVGVWPEGGTPADAVAEQPAHAAYIADALARSPARWKICAWHKNQHAMQVGRKPDETGWQVYETCRDAGAIIATAHEHSYSRTHLIATFADPPVVASTDSTLRLAKGRTFAFVSGLGGRSARRLYRGTNGEAPAPWWASVYTRDNGADAGALFCTFNPGGRKDLAECVFKTIAGDVVDRFRIVAPRAG
ncbi:MAG: metallophosphoesterase [Rhodospirillales bacterium]|nr:metallophosphoesterase [Rhodospirillales bacterium]